MRRAEALIGYFHIAASNLRLDIELGAAGLLCVFAERLELATHRLRDCLMSESNPSQPQVLDGFAAALVGPNLPRDFGKSEAR